MAVSLAVALCKYLRLCNFAWRVREVFAGTHRHGKKRGKMNKSWPESHQNQTGSLKNTAAARFQIISLCARALGCCCRVLRRARPPHPLFNAAGSGMRFELAIPELIFGINFAHFVAWSAAFYDMGVKRGIGGVKFTHSCVKRKQFSTHSYCHNFIIVKCISGAMWVVVWLIGRLFMRVKFSKIILIKNDTM